MIYHLKVFSNHTSRHGYRVSKTTETCSELKNEKYNLFSSLVSSGYTVKLWLTLQSSAGYWLFSNINLQR